MKSKLFKQTQTNLRKVRKIKMIQAQPNKVLEALRACKVAIFQRFLDNYKAYTKPIKAAHYNNEILNLRFLI